MFVWRVQNKKGQGPYTGNYKAWLKRSHCGATHPEPHHDGVSKDGCEALCSRDAICGFETKRQAFEWFAKAELERLAKRGYRLQKVEASKVWKGKRQVVFIRKVFDNEE